MASKVDKILGGMAPTLAETVRFTAPEEMRANKSRDNRWNAAAIMQDWVKRFPFNKEWVAYNPSLIKNVLLAKWRLDRTDMKQTDGAWHREVLEESRSRDQAHRVALRKEWERREVEKHGLRVTEGEDLRRTIFFRKVKDVVIMRTSIQQKARLLENLYNEELRELSRERGQGWREAAEKNMERAFGERRKWLEWRLANLFSTRDNGALIRLKGGGEPMEAVTGRAHGEVTTERTEKHDDWHQSHNFVTHPNGALVRMVNGGGDKIEIVEAKLQLPVIHERTGAFEYWHDTNFYVQTSNGSLQSSFRQGNAPEAAAALLALPEIEERIARAALFRRSGLVSVMDNGVIRHLPISGLAPERALADQYWPERAAVAAKTEVWRDGHMYKRTPNGGFAPLSEVGRSYEFTTAETAQPLKDRRREGHAEYHASHRFKRTPNGGFAPLINIGHSYERVSSEVAQPVKQERTRGFHERFLGNRFVETPNHALARLSTLGRRFEVVTGELADQFKDLVTERFTSRRDAHRLHVREDVAQRETEVSKTYRDKTPSEQPVDVAQTEPLPTTTREAPAANRSIGEKRDAKKQRSLRELQKNLAAHEASVSMLKDHVREQPAPAPVPLERKKA